MLTKNLQPVIIKMMPDQEKELRKRDERLSRVDYEEVERTRRRYLNVGNLVLIVLILAGLFFLGLLFLLRSRGRVPPPAEEKPAGENIWVPGIDYQPKKGEGE
jgi:hypothetical protein